ncbi:MAG: TonB-dependent receptor, partial [Pedobacter sp.]
SYKSPSLAQRFPGPTYFEVPLVNAYTGKVSESTYLVYVERYDPESANIKSSNSQTFELSTSAKIKDFNLSLSLFHKSSRNGISTVSNRKRITVPTYNAEVRAGQKPIITQTGIRDVNFVYHSFSNDLKSDNQGLELILSSPQIKPIATTFNISGGIFRTTYQNNALRLGSEITNGPANPEYAIIGIYEATKRISYLSNARISSATHIPKISLIVNFTADFALLQKTNIVATQGIPLGYYNRAGEVILLSNPNPSDSNYGHLFIPQNELNDQNISRIIPNFHMSIAKDIKKRFRFSFNVYNVFNYQPYYINSSNNFVFPASAPNFGAEISVKL